MTGLDPVRIPGTDLTIGPFVLGTMTFGTQLDEKGAEQAVHRSREAGVTMFDSANSYGGGRSEELLGRIVAPFRDEVQLVTKVGSYRSVDDPDAPRLDRASLLRECDGSLTRLGTDHIDLYYLHMPDPRTPIEESLAACQELVDAGKVRHLGVSNHAAWQLTEAAYLAEHRGWPRVRVSQPMYNLLARRLEEEYTACTEHLGIANLVYNPLAGGLLTGKHRRDAEPEEGTRFARRAAYVDRYWNEAQFDAVDRLGRVADEAGMTLIELSLRWLLGRDAVTGVIVGVSSIDHLDTNLAAADGPPLDASTLEAIDEVWDTLRGPAPAYNR
jgi:aryl-alcohol dehydrogenase-like predicted oxidoreductase